MEAMTADPQTQGWYLEEFERMFSNYHQGRYAYAVSSGAAALEIAAMLADLKEDDEVIIPAHTYCATAIPFARQKVRIRWADMTNRIRVSIAENYEPLITEKTKVIVVVHLYGVNAPMACIMKLARKHHILVIEDCAQSLGAFYEFKESWGGAAWIGYGPSGVHGDIACYSFHGQKNITTLGEGGMITTCHRDLAAKIPGLRHNGHRLTGDKKVVDFDMDCYPYNFSIGEAQCAVGISQFKRLDYLTHRRYNNARMIVDGLEDLEDLVFQKIPRGATHSYHLLNARHPKRDELMQVLKDRFSIECVIQYNPLYRYPLFKYHAQANCPNLEAFYPNSISFPFAEWYTEEMVIYLRDSIRKAVKSL
jgi:dTDP-4-amino-4,6-dideoxygalactose transaminase